MGSLGIKNPGSDPYQDIDVMRPKKEIYSSRGSFFHLFCLTAI